LAEGLYDRAGISSHSLSRLGRRSYLIGAAGAVFIGVGAVRPLLSGVVVELVARGAIGRSEQAAKATRTPAANNRRVDLKVMEFLGSFA
jgi:hypothetical protein